MSWLQDSIRRESLLNQELNTRYWYIIKLVEELPFDYEAISESFLWEMQRREQKPVTTSDLSSDSSGVA